ncbi:hypothetical protein [Nocardioides zeae]|uniref:Uncharacterized protein n=1 Tax=Nocardioides zeae TaxID=1457234 RepID=A0AAJ1U149_9ACTN|nr:hypothetical protein [Nocardioides zeae]MDQ1103935.1 hypothetical protein [Nocardioides zeae]
MAPWDEVDDDWPPEGDWMIRCVRSFCDAGHARAWMAAGHPLPDEWERRQPPPDSSDLGCVLGCVVALAVLVMLACLVILGAAEAWRIIF